MLRSPDPAPTLSGESVPTMAVDAGATTKPMPDPIRPNAMAMVRNPESTVRRGHGGPVRPSMKHHARQHDGAETEACREARRHVAAHETS